MNMRKLRLVKVVAPELVAYFAHGDEKIPDYRCPICSFGVADEYVCCPHCSAELDWTREDKKSKEFRELIDSL